MSLESKFQALPLSSAKYAGQVASPPRAAAYVRMSTEHQQYSTDNQLVIIREFAQRRGLEIVRLYSDEGKSGLKLKGRNALAQMIEVVQGGGADFSIILVYDVSRWGRFQDADESAYYEYLCRQSGVQIHYCAEQFENDGSPASTIVKSIKRAMAGEYSRELSNKVFQGACHLIQQGFRQGGSPGFGLRRMLVDQNGRQKGILQRGEKKSIATDRVIIVPGPEEEIKVVHWIYDTFIEEGKTGRQIARLLNERGVPAEAGRPWTHETVGSMLTNEKYIGNNVYSRRSLKLKGKDTKNPPEKWIRAEGAFKGIVDPQKFLQVQQVIDARRRKYKPEEMLARLSALFKENGYLTCDLIQKSKGLPKVAFIIRQFGSLFSLYHQLGFKPRVRYNHANLTRRLFAATVDLVASTTQKLMEVGATAQWRRNGRVLELSGELRVCVFFVRCSRTYFGSLRWKIRLRPELKPDFTILVRMDSKNEAILDYYLMPSLDVDWTNTSFARNNAIYIDTYRFSSLDFFVGMAARIQLPKVI